MPTVVSLPGSVEKKYICEIYFVNNFFSKRTATLERRSLGAKFDRWHSAHDRLSVKCCLLRQNCVTDFSICVSVKMFLKSWNSSLPIHNRLT